MVLVGNAHYRYRDPVQLPITHLPYRWGLQSSFRLPLQIILQPVSKITHRHLSATFVVLAWLWFVV